jgi:dienelactone hydrolase
MKRFRYLFLLILSCLLPGCGTDTKAPEATGIASPEAVALSLSTVDPEHSLQLFSYDPTAPLDIQEDRRWHEGDATWIDFTYASPKGGRVPTRLVIPDGKGPFPGLILQHGGPGILEEMVDFARAFARYGAVTIMITSPYRRPGGWEITQYMGNTWPMFTDRDIEIKIQTINDLQRAVDILVERPEVDPQRLAYFGVSWGSSMGGLLAGIEDRLVAYVLVAGDGGLVEHTADPGENGLNIHFSEDWAARMWPTEPLHFVGRAAPAALLFQNGVYDTFVPPHDAIRFYTAASEPKTMIWYDAGHNLPWKFVYDAGKWLQPYLGDRLLFSAPNYRPSAIVTERATIITVLLTLAVYLADTFRRKSVRWGEGLIWALGMIFLGPLGLILYGLKPSFDPNATDSAHQIPPLRQVLEITTLMTLSLNSGLFLGDRINSIFVDADFRIRFLQLYLTTLVVAWVLRYLIRRSRQVSNFTQLLMTNLFWSIAIISPLLMSLIGLGIPIWLNYFLTPLLATLVTFPLYAWMLSRGFEQRGVPGEIVMRFEKIGWPVVVAFLILSFLAAFGSVMVTVQVYSGLPWKDVFLFIVGVYP